MQDSIHVYMCVDKNPVKGKSSGASKVTKKPRLDEDERGTDPLHDRTNVPEVLAWAKVHPVQSDPKRLVPIVIESTALENEDKVSTTLACTSI